MRAVLPVKSMMIGMDGASERLGRLESPHSSRSQHGTPARLGERPGRDEFDRVCEDAEDPAAATNISRQSPSLLVHDNDMANLLEPGFLRQSRFMNFSPPDPLSANNMDKSISGPALHHRF